MNAVRSQMSINEIESCVCHLQDMKSTYKPMENK